MQRQSVRESDRPGLIDSANLLHDHPVGGLLRHAAHAHPRRRIALPVVVTSALFAAVHMQWRIMLAAFLVGLVLGQLRVASRSMVP